jgi:hypothetical protein
MHVCLIKMVACIRDNYEGLLACRAPLPCGRAAPAGRRRAGRGRIPPDPTPESTHRLFQIVNQAPTH